MLLACPFSAWDTPEISRHPLPKGNLVLLRTSFCNYTVFTVPPAGHSSCSRLRSTQEARVYTAEQVWGLTDVRDTCSGGSKSRKLACNHGEAFRALRHPGARNLTWLKQCRTGFAYAVLLTARNDCPATSCSCLLECSCPCSSALVFVLVVEWSGVGGCSSARAARA